MHMIRKGQMRDDGRGLFVSRTRCETRCCVRDEGRSLGVTLWKGTSNRHELLRSKKAISGFLKAQSRIKCRIAA
jgi:hypothetical protein